MAENDRPQKLFVDSSFFISLMDRSSNTFSACKSVWEDLILERAPLFTTHLVLSETITFLRYHGGFQVAKAFGNSFRQSKAFRLIWVDPDLDQRAWEIFLKYNDQSFSYVDCTSFALMQYYEITQALSLDKDFLKAGFSLFPLKA